MFANGEQKSCLKAACDWPEGLNLCICSLLRVLNLTDSDYCSSFSNHIWGNCHLCWMKAEVIYLIVHGADINLQIC